jgi:hypothetical protein
MLPVILIFDHQINHFLPNSKSKTKRGRELLLLISLQLFLTLTISFYQQFHKPGDEIFKQKKPTTDFSFSKHTAAPRWVSPQDTLWHKQQQTLALPTDICCCSISWIEVEVRVKKSEIRSNIIIFH